MAAQVQELASTEPQEAPAPPPAAGTFPPEIVAWVEKLHLSSARQDNLLAVLTGDDYGATRPADLAEMEAEDVEEVKQLLPRVKRRAFQREIDQLKAAKHQQEPLAEIVAWVQLEESCRLDVGTFVADAMQRGADVLARGEGPGFAMSPAQAAEVVEGLGASPTAEVESSLALEPCPSLAAAADLVGPAQRQACVDLLEHAAKEAAAEGAPPEDLKLVLDPAQAVELLGANAAAALRATHPTPTHTKLLLRRAAAHGKCIPFHTDVGSQTTVQLALNGDHEYEGGRLCFASPKRGLVVPPRPAGSLTRHDNKIAHGVSSMLAGVRYGLFVLDEHAQTG